MPSPKTFAELHKQMMEVVEFFKQTFSDQVEARSILVRNGTDERVAPEEIPGMAKMFVSAEGYGVAFIPSDPERSTFTVGSDLDEETLRVEPVLLSMEGEDIVFRMPELTEFSVKPGDQIQLVASPGEV